MPRIAITDFSGYYYDRKFIIKEIMIFKHYPDDFSGNKLRITAPPGPCIGRGNRRHYRDFLRSCGIPWYRGDYNVRVLRNELLHLIMDDYSIYVKDDVKFRQLKEFLGLGNPQRIFSLGDYGLSVENPIRRILCPFHRGPRSRFYCAYHNGMPLLIWYWRLIKITNVIIDFNGYYINGNNFIIKEFSIYGLNNYGVIVYHNFFVSKPPTDIENLSNVVDIYNRKYYEKFGINWSDGTHELYHLRTIIRNVFKMSNAIKYIFVKNKDYRNELREIINEPAQFICLNELNYKEETTSESLQTDCIYHTPENIYRHMCADFRARKMVEWIVKMKYYENNTREEAIKQKILFNVALRRERNMFYNHQQQSLKTIIENIENYKVIQRKSNSISEMSQMMIIDFNGYYYNRKFVIKEIIAIGSFGPDSMNITSRVTAPPGSCLGPENRRHYRDFRRRCGIPWNNGEHNICRLRRDLLDYVDDEDWVIYVRNDVKFRQLKEFLNFDNPQNIFIFDDYGFYEQNLIRTNICPAHEAPLPQFYCAYYSGMEMIEWYLNMLKMTTVIIDFNGYYINGNKFIMKEFSIYGLNKYGVIVYHNFFVSKPPTDIENLSNVIDIYKRNYYQKYGIDWSDGTHEISHLQTIIFNIFKIANVIEHIFVKNKDYRNELKKLIFEYAQCTYLDKLNYTEEMTSESVDTKCIYHTPGNTYRNMCADFRARKMAKWIMKMKYYKEKTIEVTTKPKILFDVALRRERDMFYNHQQKTIIENIKNYKVIQRESNSISAMSVVMIIDFSGYYYEKKFVIKEMVVIKSLGPDSMNITSRVTAPPKSCLRPENRRNYRYYLRRCGIPWNSGEHNIRRVRRELLDYVGDEDCVVYVKNDVKFRQLKEFLNFDNPQNVFILDDYGFYEENLIQTNICPAHEAPLPRFYCAYYSGMEMMKWYSNMLKMATIIIDFNGYYINGNKFIMKEFSIYGLNKYGVIVYHNFFVSKPPTDIENLSNVVDIYNRNYYQKYGIDWSDGTHELSHLHTILLNIFKITNEIIHIFVKNKDYRNELRKIIFEYAHCTYLDKLKYTEEMTSESVDTKCIYHTPGNTYRNMCADFRARKMVEWIVKMKYYEEKTPEETSDPTVLFDVVLQRERNMFYNQQQIENIKNYKVIQRELNSISAMSQIMMIDFSGYYYNRKFVIKEMVAIEIDGPDSMNITTRVTAPPESRLRPENRRHYRYFLRRCGILWNSGEHNISRLRRDLLDYVRHEECYVYVKSDVKFRQLKEFLNIDNPPSVFIVDDYGFYEENSIRTNICPAHVAPLPQFYCAYYSGMEMIKWFWNMMKMTTVIIDFNGYYINGNKFIIKEFSIYGLNEYGVIVYHNFFVAQPPTDVENISNVIDIYNQNYYQKYGIDWSDGTHELSHLHTILLNIFQFAVSIEDTFVKNKDYGNELKKIIFEYAQCTYLDKLNYTEEMTSESVDTKCIYHTPGNTYRNMCADFRARKMVDWIVEMKYYEKKTREEAIERQTLFDVNLRRQRDLFYDHQQ
ncbi:uncharacterized protein LOC130677000 [Microplitis mediator]|uniref:uncharacterized protein LOC130677000 n=1 Tax=Microplitis mediator TaxID=375433 RepID=UPI002553CA3E|nr:uncharacterized protein LOC130677000 [Microplitis mediator]